MMDSETNAENSSLVHIHAKDSTGTQYVFHPEDNDVFVRTGTQVIAGCQLGISIEVWFTELRSMFDHVGAWTRQRTAQISKVIAAPRGARTGIFVVPTSQQFDFDLADELVDLELELVQKFNVGVVEILQVPDSELSRFILQDKSMLIYDNAR